MKEIKAVVFDIDGTVTPHANSWLAFTHGLGASTEEHKKIFFEGFKGGQVSYEIVRERLTKLWRATGNANRPYIENMFSSWPVLPEAQELISFLRGKGLEIVFITGSVGIYAKIVADKFSVSDYYANGELIFDSEGSLIDFHFPHDESGRKLDNMRAFCERKGLSAEAVVALGDSYNDVGIFSETGRGILVGAEKPEILKKVAWKEIDSLTEITRILEPFLVESASDNA
jgi:HAD superfamily phosphoserine phosphatase-like hydrolase